MSTSPSAVLVVLAGSFFAQTATTSAQSAGRPESKRSTEGVARLGGPTSVQAELEEDRIDAMRSGLDRWNAWKDELFENHGLKFSLEYNSLVHLYSSAASGIRDASGGDARVFGSWTLLGKDSENPGSLVVRADTRHRYSSLAPQDGSIAAGSAVPTGTLYSDRQWGLVNLQWNQTILGGRGAIVFGMTPADDYFHTYGLGNPLTAFSSLAFSMGGDVAIPESGLGIAGGAMLDDHWYFKAGVHDANGSMVDPNLDVIGDWELYKNLEVGWTSSQEKLYFDNFHLGAWHTDARSEAGVPESWGITGNASWYFEEEGLMPFVRGSWAEGEATLVDRQLTAGIGKQFRERDLGGIGVSWASPSAPGLDDQWTTELFYRIQLGNIAITPSVLLVTDPSLNPGENLMWVGGLRGRIVF